VVTLKRAPDDRVRLADGSVISAAAAQARACVHCDDASGPLVEAGVRHTRDAAGRLRPFRVVTCVQHITVAPVRARVARC
jgi:hypothetical protein